MFEIKGKVTEVGKTQTFSSGFSKRDVIVDIAGPKSKYPNPVKFSFKKDNCALVDSVAVGDEVTVKFMVDGRKWDGPKGTSYFVDLTAIGIASGSASAGSSARKPVVQEPEGDDKMPF